MQSLLLGLAKQALLAAPQPLTSSAKHAPLIAKHGPEIQTETEIETEIETGAGAGAGAGAGTGTGTTRSGMLKRTKMETQRGMDTRK